MKAYKRVAALLSAAVVLFTAGCGSESSSDSVESSSAASSVAESSSATDKKSAPSGVSLSMKVGKSDGKLDIARAEKKNKPMGEEGTWTIFVYLCGTDLESSGQGSASSDIEQMINAKGSDKVKFVFQTGGTSKWTNENISADKAQRFVVQNGKMELADTTELTNMGDPSTLSGFLKWGIEKYPAEKMGLVVWDHGGGSISGACVDELNNGDMLTLAEFNTALSETYNSMTDQFEFIGFDCCLMGTAETANIFATYARYFYGSQECEPGSGWDYTTYGTYLAENPTANGGDLGKVIADSFYEECASVGQENSCTLTIIDLSKYDDFVVSFNSYAKELYEKAGSDLAGVVRGVTSAENFGGNNKSEGYTNMVDVGGIINQCSSYADGKAALDALKSCIVYNKNGSNHAKATGLSVYYPLKIQDAKELPTFSNICISPYYLSLVDMVAKGHSDSGYNNDAIFGGDVGEWTNTDCKTSMDDSYFSSSEEPKSEESKLITFSTAPTVTDDGTYGFVLDQNGLNNTAMVSAYICLDIDGKMLNLGSTTDIKADWESGMVADNFDGYWLALSDGTMLTSCVVEETEEYTVFTAPIKLNGKRTNLRLRVDKQYQVTIEGAWDGISANGTAAREITKIKEGDKVVVINSLLDGTEIEMTEHTWAADSGVTYAYLPQGDYYYGFTIDDVYGDYFLTDPVVFSIDESGNIKFKAQAAQQTETENEEE